MRFFNTGLVTALGLALLSQAASAATLNFTSRFVTGTSPLESQTETFTLAPNDGRPSFRRFATLERPSGNFLNFAQFDPTIGTLDEVRVTFSIGEDQTVLRTTTLHCRDDGRFNDACRNSSDVTVRNASARVGIFVPEGTDIFGQAVTDFTLARTTGPTTYSTRGSTRLDLERNARDTPANVRYTSNLSQFIGPSNVSFEIFNSFRAELDVDCDASIGASVTECEAEVFYLTRNSVSGQITYNYTPFADPDPVPSPVPLPAGAWLLLAGLGALGALNRFKART